MNIEIKGNLAKLLATENLLVEHKKVETASFDVQNRVLTLPIWKTSNDVYNMLVGHEVGHALYTPDEDPTKLGVPMSFINVTEDARIEKLMKRKFPGLQKDFHKAYSQLTDNDFFEIEGKDLTELTLVDRINLHYKIGSYAMVPFTAAETPLKDAAGVTETFEEALQVAKDIFKFMKAEFEKKQKEEGESQSDFSLEMEAGQGEGEKMDNNGQQMPSPNAQGEQIEGEDETGDSNSDGDQEFGGNQAAGELPDYGRQTEEEYMEVTTQNAFDSKTRDLADLEAHAPSYVNVPTVYTDKVIVDNKSIWDRAENHWQEEYREFPERMECVDELYRQWSKDTQKDVNYLVKEFECKKAATSYARSSESKTGTLDTTKLHKYKFSEDIFKKITAIPEGKNHGLVFLLDWSGSMSREIFDTVKQLINLTQFCKKVNIPFDVYAFLHEGSWGYNYGDEDALDKTSDQNVDDLWIDPRFRMYNLLTSEGNSKDFTRQTRNLFRVAKYFDAHHNWNYDHPRVPAPPHFLGLGGTPLNEGLATCIDLLPKWRTKQGVEKCHLVVLTDGEAQQIGQVHAATEYINRKYEFHLNYRSILRDKKTGRYYSDIKNGGPSMTAALIRVIRDRYTWCNVLGFRLCPPREFSSYMSRMGIWEQDEYKKQWKKDRLAVIKTAAYSELYVIANGKNEDTTMEVAADATKRQLTSAFKKSLKGKGANRRLLSAFAGQIA